VIHSSKEVPGSVSLQTFLSGWSGNFLLHKFVQTNCSAHANNGYEGLFCRGKAVGAWIWSHFHVFPKLRKLELSLYASIVWHWGPWTTLQFTPYIRCIFCLRRVICKTMAETYYIVVAMCTWNESVMLSSRIVFYRSLWTAPDSLTDCAWLPARCNDFRIPVF
jgi:hypothetical protein